MGSSAHDHGNPSRHGLSPAETAEPKLQAATMKRPCAATSSSPTHRVSHERKAAHAVA